MKKPCYDYNGALLAALLFMAAAIQAFLFLTTGITESSTTVFVIVLVGNLLADMIRKEKKS